MHKDVKQQQQNAIQTEEVEVRMFQHKCEMCGRRWQSEQKADTCNDCGHWNLTFSSFLVFKKAENIKQNRRLKKWQTN